MRRLRFESLEIRLALSTFSVLNVNDSGVGSLRQAILDANANSGTDLIDFNISGSGVHTIQPLSALPTITSPVTIDGYSQTGSSVNTLSGANNAVLKIELDGSLAGLSPGLWVTAGGSTVRGLAINRFALDGIRLEQSDGNVVEGSFVGTDPTGTIEHGNGSAAFGAGSGGFDFYGILIGNATYPGYSFYGSSFNRIGTNGDGVLDEAERNVISGNDGANVVILGLGSDHNIVAGNLIGTDATGTVSLSLVQGAFSEGYGVGVLSGAQFNRIGTDGNGVADANERNVISGNNGGGSASQHDAGNGVLFYGTATENNWVAGNYIGTDVTGTLAIPNQASGVKSFSFAGKNLIGTNADGTADAAERNIISGNLGNGILLEHSNPNGGTVVAGNFIGTDVSGTSSLPNSSGVQVVTSTGNLIGGTSPATRNVISGNTFYGVSVQLVAEAGNRVQGNFIGVDATGAAAVGNLIGVSYSTNLVGGNVLIGGTTPGAGNVISGNGRTGVELYSFNATVQGNYIGTDASGTVDLGNRGVTQSLDGGVVVHGSNHLIGGASPDARNVISGNELHGVFISGSDNVVQGNYIGTDVTGTVGLGNTNVGVNIIGGSRNTIGGSTPGAGNLISANGRNAAGTAFGANRDGVLIFNVATADNVVEGNFIGVDANGAALGNLGNGVASKIAPRSHIMGNVIANNAFSGVVVTFNAGVNGIGNDISRNSIVDNGRLGMDLADNGVTANDLGDADTGANNLQNFPVITSATSSALNTIVQGTLNARANSSFTVEFFANVASDPSGFGEGQRFIGSGITTTDAVGNASFSFTFPMAVAVGQLISATATLLADTDSNPMTPGVPSDTSEFSGLSLVNPYVPASISGQKFNDLDNDGQKDVGEPGLASWRIFIDSNLDGAYEAGEPTTLTNFNGNYTFTSLEPGTYRVRDVAQAGWSQTTANPADVVVNASGQSFANMDFGNHQDDCPAPGVIIGPPQPFDLSTFSVVQYEFNLQPNAGWVLSNNNTVATQTVNADPSILLGLAPLPSNVVEGSWRVGSSGDDDFMGFVFGYQDTEHFYVFDWKQATQNLTSPNWGIAEQGMSVKVVNANSPLTGNDLWPTSGNGTRVQSLAHNTISWQVGVDYDFRLDFQPEAFTITVKQGAVELDSFTIHDSTYTSGRFGFYNFSQHNVIYSGFSSATITPIQTTMIEGTKFHDLDGDGVRDNSEPGLAGWTIQLDAAANGSVDDTTTTDANGNYRFTGLSVGTYRVREVQQAGWTQTSVNPQDLVLTSCDDVISGIDFGNLDRATITGTKFFDADGNGVQNHGGEPGLAHWPIFLDTNGDGIHGVGEPLTYSNLFGTYSFTNLVPGTYRVRELQQPGWIQTTPNPADITITANGQVFGDVDFGNDRDDTVTLITGTKFNDADGNGVQNVGEAGLAYWPIFVDANSSGAYEVGEPLTWTNPFGDYSLPSVTLGTYRIREIQRPGWTQTTANPADVVITALGQTVNGIAFGNQRDATTGISGRKFFDADGDGAIDPGEPGLRYWPIYLDTNGDGSHQAGEPLTWTGWNGEYSFVGIAPGTYRVREIQQTGWSQTSTNPADVVVTADGQTFDDINFGNQASDGPGPGVNPPIDLDVSKDAPRAVAGEQITYTLRVTNRGPVDSYGVILGDQLAPGLVFESATPSQGTCRGGQTIICAMGPMAVGDTATVTIVAHVLSWVKVEVENEACVYSSATDTVPPNNCAIARTPIDIDTDLRLVKTADGLRAIAGRDMTYTLRVTNNGPSDSTNVQLEDELPPEVTFVSVESTHGTCTLEVTTVDTVVCELGTVANGETAIVTLVVHVGPWVPEDAIITNIGRVRDPYGSSGESIIRIPCGRSTDFELTKTGPFTTVNAEVYYVIEVTNHGPSNSAGPIVGDDLPDEIDFLYAVPSQGFCNQADPLLCNLGPMVVGQTETVTVFVGVPETVVIEDVRNEAVVHPPEGDPNPYNNWGGTGGIRPIYDLGMVKAAPPEIPAGEYLTYTLEVTNEGPDNASNVIVGDTLPAGLILVSATASQGFCFSGFNPIICFLGAMEVGDVETVTIVVLVPPSIPEGTVFLNMGYAWGNPPGFSGSATRVIRRGDIHLEKIAPPDVVAGTEMTYTLRTRNRGPSDSTNITLEDVLPAEVDFISATPSQGTCADSEDAGQTTVSCALGDIPSGGVAEVEIVVFVPSFVLPGTVIANQGCATALVLDPDLTNNCAVVHTDVVEASDVQLIKVSTPGPVTAGENIEYTLEVHNKGPSDTRHVVLGDTLAAPLVFVSATATQGTCDYISGVVRCDIGYVAVGQHEFVTIVAFVPPTTLDGTVVENTACIIECGHDIFPDNDCSTVRNTIRAQSGLYGVKFNDMDGDGVQDTGELGIPNWQIFLDLDGDQVLDANERSTFTDANGVYTFTGLGKTTWYVREVQNAGWLQTTLDPPGVTVSGWQRTDHGGDFGNKQGSIAGRVFIDPDNDGILDFGEIGIGGVTISLIGSDDLGNVNRTVLTSGDGSYRFGSLRPGIYRVIESPPTGYVDGKDHLGTAGGTVINDEFFLNLGRGQDGKDYDFGELQPAKLSGYVYNDTDNDGQIDFGEQAVPNAGITLTGTNDLNEIINRIVTTDTQGYYEFGELRPGTYAMQEQQPTSYVDGKDTVGTLGGTMTNDRFSSLVLGNASTGMNYNFGEHADVGLQRGQTATIGYWQNKNGQTLLLSLNGGANSTALGNWLASNLSNMYGANAGANNLAGKTNTQIAAYYVTLFKQKGQKLGAQVLATAFAAYVTDSDLAGNNAAPYGFTVNSAGTGAATFSVGSSGAAFGVANNTRLSILQILTATNAQTVNGNLYNGSTSLRNLANTVYDGINQGGDIY